MHCQQLCNDDAVKVAGLVGAAGDGAAHVDHCAVGVMDLGDAGPRNYLHRHR